MITSIRFPGVDLVIEASVELLAGNAYARCLQDIAADRADGVPLQYFQRVYDHEVDPEEINEFPCAFVAAMLDERGTPESSTVDVIHRLQVGVYDNGADPSMLTKRIQRMALAVHETFRRYGASMLPYVPTGEPILGSINWLPIGLLAGKPQPLTKAAAIDIGIATIR